MLAHLILCLAPCQQLDALAETLFAATDKASYEDGAYAAAKQLAGIRTPQAMELRLELFDRKWDTYRGVYLREWFYSGYLKAEQRAESDLMLKAAANRRQSDWHRILLLRALGRCRAEVSAKALLVKAFDKAPAAVRREWASTLGILLAEDRLDFTDVKLGRLADHEALVRKRLLDSGIPDGFAALRLLTTEEIGFLARTANHSRDPGDRAIALRILGAHTESWPALVMAAPKVFASRDCGPRTALLEATVEHRIYTMAPSLITALAEEAQHTPNRFTGDLGSTLRALTGQSFGDSPGMWEQWFQQAGESWMSAAIADPNKARAKIEHRHQDTVARFFGLAVETSNVVVLVDGSGSMSASKLGELSCAAAAAVEVGRFLDQLPKESMFQVIVIEPQPILGFKKLMRATRSNRAKAVKFLRSRPYKSTSALYDALEAATADPLVDTLILVSDGGSSAGKHQYSGNLLDSARRLHQRTGVRIHTVLVTDSTRHEAFLRELAEDTGGRMVRP